MFANPPTAAMNAANAIKRDAPIPAQVTFLRSSSEMLHQTLNAFLEKIAPTLGAAPAGPSVDKARGGFPGNSPLGSELCSINENILDAINRLQQALDSMEL